MKHDILEWKWQYVSIPIYVYIIECAQKVLLHWNRQQCKCREILEMPKLF